MQAQAIDFILAIKRALENYSGLTFIQNARFIDIIQ